LPGVVRGCGLAPVLAETGAQLLDCTEPHEFDAPDNVVARRITLAKALLQADVVITLPKLKTHVQMTLTGALKNQYGLIPGALKSQWHFRLQQPEWLASLILDVNRTARPALAIMDAVIAMEGQGPSSGKPRFLGALIASPDLAAADTLACHLIGQDPMRVPLLVAARTQRFGQTDLKQIQLAGDDWRSLRVPDFEKVEHLLDLLRLVPLPKPALKWISRQWTVRPRIIDGQCTRCGICEKGCPVTPSAIHPNAAPDQRIDDDRCIHCYCCHEFCPSHGIELRQPWLARHLPLNALANGASRLLGYFTSPHGRS
jgi:ferredoxin